MITYPSYARRIRKSKEEVCEQVHAAGGQVTWRREHERQVEMITWFTGSDVSLLELCNVHSVSHTVVAVRMGPSLNRTQHLSYQVTSKNGTRFIMVSAADLGSASILPISWAYIAMMGEPFQQTQRK